MAIGNRPRTLVLAKLRISGTPATMKSNTRSDATATRGPSAAEAIGMKINPQPKPEKPRASPARKAPVSAKQHHRRLRFNDQAVQEF